MTIPDKEVYILKEAELIAFIQGKSLNFYIPDLYRIEIRPPNHGITISYKNWEMIKRYLMGFMPSFQNMETFINMIEERKE